MKIEKDKNNLLTIFNENIPQTKEYAYHVSGYMFSDFDKWIIILHKKQWKIISLKNLGDNMNVVYIKNAGLWKVKIALSFFEDALRIFQWFNEENGQKYWFIPNIQEKELTEKNNILQKIGSKCVLKKTEKGILVDSLSPNIIGANDLNKYFSLLFGLVVIYGKFETKNGELQSCKIQLPLSLWYLSIQEGLDNTLNILRQLGVFLKVDKLTNKNGITYQISSNDYEVLEIFAQWYEPVEKFEKITKREFTQEMKISLIEFIKTNTEIPQEGKDEVLKQITEWTIKLLTKQ